MNEIRSIDAISKAEIQQQAREAFEAGHPTDDNPYPKGTTQACWWDTEWQRVARERDEVEA